MAVWARRQIGMFMGKVSFLQEILLVYLFSAQISLLLGQGGISCNDQVQLSVDAVCTAMPEPDMFLEGTYPDYSDFSVTVYQGASALPLPLGAEQVGNVLTVQVVQLSTGNSCWSSLQLLDVLPPQWDCPADTLWVSCAENLYELPPPSVTDNCDSAPLLQLTGESLLPWICGTDVPWQLLMRSWQAVDASGNASSTCVQYLAQYRPQLGELSFPPPFTLPCDAVEADPLQTGYPTLGGIPLNGQEGDCALGVTYSDEWLQGCGGSFYILRSWTILDWCTSPGPDNPLTHLQLISVSDDTPPEIDCLDTLWVAVNEEDCSASFAVPQPEVFDYCSAWSLSWAGVGFSLSANDTLVEHLPKGEYAIAYTALDACGHTSSCQTIVVVRDEQAPTAICDAFTVVSLPEEGVAAIQAADLDDGSYDWCSPVSFAGRRMNDSLFSQVIYFSCEDIFEDSLFVELQVVDAAGNVNGCVAWIAVQDKLPPQLEELENMELGCYQDFGDTTLTAWPEAWDACGYELLYEEFADLDVCGAGTVERRFTAVDPSGNSTSHVQFITLLYDQPLTEEDITWPEDYQAPDCSNAQSLLPDSLPAGYNRPVLAEQACGLVASSYEDALFDVAEPACFKIIRSWTLIDWCNYDPQNPDNGAVFTHQQIIKVTDETPPALICPVSGFVKLTTPYCADTVLIPPLQVDDCSPSVEIEVLSDLGEGFGPFPDVPLGEYQVNYSVTDGCGNSSYCSYILRLVDAKKPTPYCKEALVITIMQTGMISVDIRDFDAGSFDNCTAQEDLQFSYGFYPGDTVRTFFCEDLGVNTVKLWVFDEVGNKDYCETYLEVQDPMEVCQPFDFEISGRVATPGLEPLAGVQVSLSGSTQQQVLTGADGEYVLNQLMPGGDYTVTPGRPDAAMDGVTTFDLVLISRHILQIDLFASPYQLIAADVNGSGTVSSLDMVLIQKRILGLIDAFPIGEDWVFIPADYSFPNPQNPFSPPFPHLVSFNNVQSSQYEVDFVAVQLGNPSAMGF